MLRIILILTVLFFFGISSLVYSLIVLEFIAFFVLWIIRWFFSFIISYQFLIILLFSFFVLESVVGLIGLVILIKNSGNDYVLRSVQFV